MELVVALGAAATSLCTESEESLYKGCAKPKRKHKHWVRPWLVDRREEGQCNTAYKLQKQLVLCDVKEFGKMLRMPPDTFNFILERIRHLITRNDTNYRKSIPAEERLSITLKYLATGESTLSLGEAYRVGQCTVGRIIKDTCSAIYEELGQEFIKTPTSREEWEDVACQFYQRWNYPACIGAMDGKHVRIIRPSKSGSTFFNYKDYYSIIMLAIVNANYEYIYLDVGGEGKVADGATWKQTEIYHALERDELDIPPPMIPPGMDTGFPCHFVADNAFAMSERVLKPFPTAQAPLDDRQAVFNYRLSRARRIVENVFGITVSRFRVLTTCIYMNPNSVMHVLLAIATLHNILRQRCGAAYMPPGSVDREGINYEVIEGAWRKEKNIIADLEPTTARNPAVVAKRMRESMADYFMSANGEVHWQYKHIHNTHDNLVQNLDTA